MEQIKGMIQLAEEAIENGSITVEEIHQEIASKPLQILKQFDGAKEAANKIEQVQAEIIGSTYDTVRFVTTQVGSALKDMLDKVDK